MKNLKVLNEELKGFNGADYFVRHRVAGLLFSSGVDLLRKQYDCYWLIDEILLTDIEIHPMLESDFYVWTLERIFDDERPTTRFMLSVGDGDGAVLGSKEIPFSDFQYDKLVLWFENDLLFIPDER